MTKKKASPIEDELKKVRQQKTDISSKLDEFSKGVDPSRIQEFNDLCSQEFALAMKERLLNRKPGDSMTIVPPMIQRRITITPGTPTKISH